MLESSLDRVKLLKAGITGKTIERVYITENNFRMIRSPIFLNTVKMESKEIAKVPFSQRVEVEMC